MRYVSRQGSRAGDTRNMAVCATAGYGNGNYGPCDNVTREQLAAILNYYSTFSGMVFLGAGQTVVFDDDALLPR